MKYSFPSGIGTNVLSIRISGNVIEGETVDIAAKTPAQVNIHLNNLTGGDIGVDNIGAGTVDATLNWWGCSNGPGAGGCTSVEGPGVSFTPWLRHPIFEIGN